jgi:hypothetical protein
LIVTPIRFEGKPECRWTQYFGSDWLEQGT